MCSPASRTARAAAVFMLLLSVSVAVSGTRPGMDNYFVVKAARTLMEGGSPYADKRFLYLPSSVFAAVPEALMPERAVLWGAPFAATALVMFGWWCSLRIFSVSPGSRLAVLGVAALVYFAPFRDVVGLANWTAFSVAAMPFALLMALRSRWTAAGAVVGVAIAFKPMLVPFALILLFARRPRAFALAAAIPAVASLLAALAMPRPTLFITKTLPFLFQGQDNYARPFDGSLSTVLPRLGLPQGPAMCAAGALALAGLYVAWMRWRRGGDERLRLVETGSMIMLSVFLVSRPSFLHYVLVVLLPLLASMPVRGSAARSPWFWFALIPQVHAFVWPYLATQERRAFKDAWMFCALAAVVAHRCVAAGRAAVPEREAGQGSEHGAGRRVGKAVAEGVGPCGRTGGEPAAAPAGLREGAAGTP
ncbi:glycosyltransferase family 87 protein [Wenjunlia tyrosinilytica]|uniref:glycosyltransferase family 87 protein n=1 Tax=Wenjunlia tyrosinilytica TaxID=1544741 RepID=UPI001E337007|nr:glycosyltransferase family 87 protein [Wenjunlia tyrosinilytica]